MVSAVAVNQKTDEGETDETQDEIVRQPPDTTKTSPETRSSRQTSLQSFFSSTKPRRKPPKMPTHRLLVSDSKTRASGTLPRDSDTLAGRLQVMLYKELLDAMLLSAIPESGPSGSSILPTQSNFSFERLFKHLQLGLEEPFSDDFVRQSRVVILGNGLRYGTIEARTLSNMIRVWQGYVSSLGLGIPRAPTSKAKAEVKGGSGRTEDKLELIYRRAAALKKKHGRRKSGAVAIEDDKTSDVSSGEEKEIQLAIEASLNPASSQSSSPAVERSNQSASPGKEEDELAWAVEMSLEAKEDEVAKEEDGQITLHTSQHDPDTLPEPSSQSDTTPPSLETTAMRPRSTHSTPTLEQSGSTQALAKPGNASGSIIGHHIFTHSPNLLATHLTSALEWWMGERDPVGVSLEETRRCGRCEFEEGCEWRSVFLSLCLCAFASFAVPSGDVHLGLLLQSRLQRVSSEKC